MMEEGSGGGGDGDDEEDLGRTLQALAERHFLLVYERFSTIDRRTRTSLHRGFTSVG